MGRKYSIDAWGNLMISPMGGKAHGGNFQHAGDVNNRAAGLGYDAAGNPTNYTAPGQYVYDPENRIQSTAGVSYTYDADGNRVKKSGGSVSTLYWYGAPGIIAESDLSGTLKSEYVFFNGKRLARIDLPHGTVHYYLSDHLNSTSMVINGSGDIEDESDYSPFGTEYALTSSGLNHYKFTSKERDSESGLDYFGARYYSNGLGRFITPDWAAKAAAVPYAEFSDPQSLNLYSYVRNVPTAAADLDGHDYMCLPCLAQAVKNWFGSGVARDGGTKNFAKNNAIGAAKGTGAFAVNTIKTGVALGQAANLNPAGAVQTIMTPLPKALQPSNQTQAQASTATQVTLGVATAAIPIGGAETAATTGTTSLFRAVDSAEAAGIDSLGGFSASPTGSEFKGFFFNEGDASSFGSRMTDMTGDTHSVVSAEAPTDLVNASPTHNAATEGRGVLIKNEDLPQVKVKIPKSD